MNVLLTNIVLDQVSGTVAYTRDLALALKHRGIHVEIYTHSIGEVGLDLIAQGIVVFTSLTQSKQIPDIIHAHHSPLLIDALFKYRNAPAIYWIHDRYATYDKPVVLKNIMKYFAVDYFCMERYTEEVTLNDKYIQVIFNWSDTSKFKQRIHFATAPKKALVFSNYASDENYLNYIKEACRRCNISLDVMGLLVGNYQPQPQLFLDQYDIIFAKAKAAIEAMCTGAAVIVCDANGYAGRVTKENFDFLRMYNFGRKTMTQSYHIDHIVRDIESYNVDENKSISDLIRSSASLDQYMDQLMGIYTTCIQDYKSGDRGASTAWLHLYSLYIHQHYPAWASKTKAKFIHIRSKVYEVRTKVHSIRF